MNKNLLFYDTFERHKKIANLIGNNFSILDIGGQLNALSQFLNAKKIVVANIEGSEEKSDITYKKDKLPFKSNSFDIVCSIDVLEHIPKRQRESFIKDIFKIATKKVVLSFPIGTPEHEKYEQQLESYLEKKGRDVTYLKEHIKYKLPTESDLKTYLKDYDYKIYYSGNLRLNKILFKMFLFDPKIKLVRKLVYNAKLAFNIATNEIIYTFLSNKKLSSSVNRAYLVIYKNQ